MSESHWPPRRGDTVWDGSHVNTKAAAYGYISVIVWEDKEVVVVFPIDKYNPDHKIEEYTFDDLRGNWKEINVSEYAGYWQLNYERANFTFNQRRGECPTRQLTMPVLKPKNASSKSS